jgi:alkylhydroperoxidase family enzyme
VGGRTALHDLFDERERALLGLARLSATMPLATPRRFAGPAYDLLSPRELIEAAFVCALASMVQRFTAVMRPEASAEARDRLARADVEVDTLRIRAGIA